MKFLILTLTCFIIAIEYDSEYIVDSNKKAINYSEIDDVQGENLSVKYTTQTRGFYERITLSKSSLKISQDRNENISITYKILEHDWQEIKHLIATLDIKNLSLLNVPTEKRFSDRVLIAGLTIKLNEKVFSTQEFDHGNPPSEIKKLIKKILSIKKVASRQ
jgi:hypothetical protein